MKSFHPLLLALFVVSFALSGCSTSGLPRGARLVGGGLMINYEASVQGTAILIERTSGRVVATESISAGSNFEFAPNRTGYSEVLYRMFASTNSIGMGDIITVPTNTFFQLYFVPAPVK